MTTQIETGLNLNSLNHQVHRQGLHPTSSFECSFTFNPPPPMQTENYQSREQGSALALWLELAFYLQEYF